MTRGRMVRWAAPLLMSTFCAMLAGCAGFQTQTAYPVYKAPLDGGRSVELRQYMQHNETLPGPHHNFVTLGLYVTRHREDPGVGAVIVRQVYERAEEVEPVDLGRLEVRTNAERDRVWVVDRNRRRVVGSLHCRTGYATGQWDVAPEWATVDGGRLLMPYRHSFALARAAD